MSISWLFLFLAFSLNFDGGLSYVRPPPRRTLSIPFPDDPNSPQQVHISMAGVDKMRISWMTKEDAPTIVEYGTSTRTYAFSATGSSHTYKYLTYKSQNIHEVVIGPLKPNTEYYYICSSYSGREFSFKTPPANFPIKFAVAGDLSYADFIQPLWDSFGQLVEPLASQRPWMVTQGNHEVEKVPILHKEPFTSYNARWHMPFEGSGSDSNLYYSFDVSGIHVIMLGSYAKFEPESAQYKWLKDNLSKVDRSKTPWIVVLIHAPWYNTNTAHQGEYESEGMKKFMEGLLYEARVDIVFAGHVHAYERFDHVYNGQANKCGPIHITIGDGGNREGLARKYMEHPPEISIFREASFGHGQLYVVNATDALWTWHRNDNDEQVAADSVWLRSFSSDPTCKS